MIAAETLLSFAPLGRPRTAEGGRPYTNIHWPITPRRTPFSFPASNHATF